MEGVSIAGAIGVSVVIDTIVLVGEVCAPKVMYPATLLTVASHFKTQFA
jgi:hypothetical protein